MRRTLTFEHRLLRSISAYGTEGGSIFKSSFSYSLHLQSMTVRTDGRTDGQTVDEMKCVKRPSSERQCDKYD